MGFLDQMQMQQPSQQPGGVQVPGQMGMAQRPRQRFIDRVLMRQQNRNSGQAAQMTQTGPQGPALPSSPGFGRM